MTSRKRRRTSIAGMIAVACLAGVALSEGTSEAHCSVSAAACARGRVIYVSQSGKGSGRGNSCGNAHSVAWFDDRGSWRAGPGGIHPGVTVGICGTITSTLGFRGHGRPGARIVVLFEPRAKLSQAVCNPCLNAVSASYVTVDGGKDGTIESTQDGTALRYHVAGVAIDAMGCVQCTFENLRIENLYVHTSPTDTAVNASEDNAIRFSGRGLTIAHNVIHDVGWALYASWSNGDGDDRIYGNTIYRIDHGFSSTAGFPGGSIGPIYFYGNHLSDFANWDTTTDAYHHDGVHCYTIDDSGTASHYNGLYIYDNRFGGDVGQNANAMIFMEGAPRHDSADTPCADTGSRVYIFNNVMTSTDRPTADDYLSDSAGGGGIYNNTVLGQSKRITIGGCSGYSDQPAGGTVAFENNVLADCNNLMHGAPSGDYTPGSPNYNVYADGGNNAFVCNDDFLSFAQFAAWKQCMHADGHSRAVASAGLDRDGAPAGGSAVVGAGTNLTPLCRGALMPLCRNINGAPRPRRGPWDAGAY